MKKIFFVIAAFFAVSSLSSCSYNSIVELDQQVKSQWAQVENVYQRRSDLIPNLVATVKGAANFEKSTLVEVTQARASATQMKIDPANLTPENIQKYQAAQGQLTQALSRLLVVTENYPELKANANFQELQAQIEGSENRITVERQKFNEVTMAYNTKIKKFPANLTSGMFGFKEKGYFTADAGASKAPKVEF